MRKDDAPASGSCACCSFNLTHLVKCFDVRLRRDDPLRRVVLAAADPALDSQSLLDRCLTEDGLHCPYCGVFYPRGVFRMLVDSVMLEAVSKSPRERRTALRRFYRRVRVCQECNVVYRTRLLRRRCPICGTLGRLAEHAPLPAAAPGLCRMLQDENPQFRAAAAWTIGQIGPEARDAVGPLATCLKDPDRLVRKAAVIALSDIRGGDDEKTARLLGEALQDPDRSVRQRVVETLGRIGPPAAAAAGALTAALSDTNKFVAEAAAQTLGDLGSKAAEATDALIDALQDTNGKVRRTAAWALGRIGPAAAERAIGPLCAALRDGSWKVRLAAAEALASFGPAATSAKPALAEAQRDKDENVRQAVRRAMRAVG